MSYRLSRLIKMEIKVRARSAKSERNHPLLLKRAENLRRIERLREQRMLEKDIGECYEIKTTPRTGDRTT